MSDGSLLSNDARNRFRARVQPYAAGLARLGLTPNMLTLIGFGIAIVAAVLAGLEAWVAAGIVSVVADEPEWRVISSHKFGGKIYGTPVLDGKRIIIRTEDSLYCYEKKEAAVP